MSAATMIPGVEPTAPERRRFGRWFVHAATTGPMRFFLLGGFGLAFFGTVLVVTLGGSDAPPESSTPPQARLNPLPGGLNSSEHQNRVALVSNQQEAAKAQAAGTSFTPPMAASTRVVGVGPVVVPPEVPLLAPAPAPAIVVQAHAPPRPAVFEPAAAPVRVAQAATAPPDAGRVRLVNQANAQQPPVDDPAFRAAVNNLFGGWQGRPSRTTVTLPPGSARAADGDGDETGRASGQAPPFARGTPVAASTVPVASAASPPPPAARSAVERVLVPAGRGIYAHTVLAVNSDSGGPIVLEADTGPVAGARMIGTFSRGSATSERLVVRVTSMQYRGQTIQVDGLVIAPDTLETSVATSVDQHYAARFLLPAAAAFVEGLGQAIATTSNTFGQVSPFGGQSYITRLNPEQQVAVGAGAAASRVGRELDRSAPRGPTIHLAANAAVGVMFLTNVTAPN